MTDADATHPHLIGPIAWPERPLPEEPGGSGGVWAVYQLPLEHDTDALAMGAPRALVVCGDELAAYKAALREMADGVVWWPYDTSLHMALIAHHSRQNPGLAVRT